MKCCAANRDIREYARKQGVPLWSVADCLGLSEPTMTRRLRRELPQTEKEKIGAIISRLAQVVNDE